MEKTIKRFKIMNVQKATSLFLLWCGIFILCQWFEINKYKGLYNEEKKNSKLKDSLYIECNGKIKALNNSFTYRQYLKNNGY